MNFFNDIKIGKRLGAAFAAVIALAAAVVVIGITRLSDVTESITLIGNDRVPKVQMLVKVTDQVNLIARELRNALLLEDPAKVATSLDIAQKAREEAGKILDTLAPSIKSDEGKKQMAVVLEASRAYLPLQQQVMDLARAGKKAEAVEMLFAKLRPAQLAYMKALDELKNLQVDLISRAAKQGEADYAQAKLLMFGLLAGMALMGAFLAWYITRSITRQLGGEPDYASDVASEIAKGNLAVDVTVRAGDTSSLLAAMKAMRDNLAQVVSNVRQSSDNIATGSAQIATGNADLSQRTEEQASNLQQTAASMEQLTSTVKQNSDTARQANQLATSASEAAARGGVVVGEVVSTMEAITTSSKKISDIISVIDGIAFQTNILALNAAVEAARAGEQGRGFAVVASEVRSLAQRSATAAKEIKTLIGESVEKVETGSRLVGDAGKSMQDIVSQVKRVNDLIAEISSASVEQSQGISQVGEAVAQLDQVTQQNAALVEESAAAAESLKQQAANLAEVVSVFKLSGGVGAGSASYAAPIAANAAVHERRSPNRAANVSRPAFKAKPVGAPTRTETARSPDRVVAKTGTDNWETF